MAQVATARARGPGASMSVEDTLCPRTSTTHTRVPEETARSPGRPRSFVAIVFLRVASAAGEHAGTTGTRVRVAPERSAGNPVSRSAAPRSATGGARRVAGVLSRKRGRRRVLPPRRGGCR
jgi:hypothetical protein